MKRSIYILIILFVPLLSFAQNQTAGEKINMPDSNGKKQGKYLEYIDRNWHTTGNIRDAYYSRYSYYNHGTPLTIPANTYTNSDKLTIDGKDAVNTKGEPKLLNGRYCWYDKKGALKDILTYKDGEIVTDSNYYKAGGKNKPAGRLCAFFNSTNKYQGQPDSWYVEKYDNDGKVIFKGHFRKYSLLDYKTNTRNYVWAVYEE